MPQKIALVGIGKIARDQHIPSISRGTDFTLAATASRNAQIKGISAYPDLATLLSDEPDIACISLCTPPQVRYEDARLALDAGRHVMLEKPPGATLSEVHDLEARAKANGVTVFATWHSREAMAVDAARDWLASRRLTKMRISWKEDVRQWHPGQDWIWEAGGLGVFDPGINALSVMTRILPNPVHLSKASLQFPENRDTPISAQLHFRGDTAAQITADFDWLKQGEPAWTIELETPTETARLTEGGACFTTDDGVTKGADEEYSRLYSRFGELTKTGTSDVDLAPMRHVADAFTLGKRETVAAFHW